MMTLSRITLFALVAICLCPPAGAKVPVEIVRLPPVNQDDGFWTAMLTASDGRVYMGMCTHGGSSRLHVYEPQTGGFRELAMIQQAVHEMDTGREPQSKLHSQILEDAQGRIWFGTDIGHHLYFNMWDDARAYPGGHMLRYDPKKDVLQDLGIPFPGAAIRHLVMDAKRQTIYAVTFPRGELHAYNMKTERARLLGRVNNWDSIARVMVKDDHGNIYGSFAPYRIFKYDPAADKLTDLPVRIPHLEGPWCDRGHGHRENVWRNAVWHPGQRVIYGMEMGSATLFRFDPATNAIADLGQMVATEFEGNRIVPFTPHGFVLDGRGENLYYTAPRASVSAPMQLLRFNTRTGEKHNLGEMFAANGDYATDLHAASVGPDGRIYFAGWIGYGGKPDTGKRENVFGLVILNPADAEGKK